MSEQKTYTVMELAALLEVPRTTVNDWLNRYAKYIDFQNVGRRRVYPESALTVLKDISKLRASGLALPAIESELEKTHAVRAEEIPETPVQETEIKGNDAKDPEASALVSKHESDEIGRVIGESFRDMAGRMQELESHAARSEKRLLIGYVIIFLLLLSLASGLYLLFKVTGTGALKTQETSRNLQELSAKTVSLAGTTEEVRQGIRELQQGLEKQKKEFAEAMKNMKDSKKAELALQKEKFAAERAALLKDLENMTKDKDQIIRELQEKLRTQNEKIAKAEKNAKGPGKEEAAQPCMNSK